MDLDAVQKKFVALANAVPADKLSWRPSPDSRSFAEVFLHVAGERYGILSLMGAEKPAGYDRKTFEKSTTDRAQIVAASDGFSGAEIEQAGVAGLYRALASRHALSTDLLLEEIRQTIPLSVTRREDIVHLREIAHDRFVSVC